MVPQTYPSVYNTYTNRTEMVVYELTSITGKVRWTDYIPVKLTTSTNAAKDNTTDNDGCIAISPLGSITNKQAFTDYIPIYVDNGATDAWAVSATGYIPYGISSAAIGILKRFGTDAHVYLPGIGALSGLQAANYLDSVGTTLATVDSPVGLVLDAAGSVGVELFPQFTGPISAVGAGWVLSGGVATATACSSVLSDASNYTAYVTGLTYQVTVVVGSRSAGTFHMYLRGNQVALNISAPGTYTYFAVAGPSTAEGLALLGVSGFTGVVSSASVKQVTGIHATQPTTAAKPRLERGVRNLLTWSSDFSNAAWTLAGTAAKQSASVVTLSATSDSVGNSVTTNATVGTTATAAMLLSGSGTIALYVVRVGAGAYEDNSVLVTLTETPTLYAVSKTIVNASQTGFRVALVKTAGSSATSVTSGGAALFQGTLTAAQILAEGGIPITTTAAASNPSAGKYSWAFDGGDSLSLGSVPFQMSDDHAVIVGLNCTSISSSARAFSCASTASTTPRICDVHLNSSGFAVANWVDDAAVVATITGSTDLRGQAVVISARKVGNNKVLRVNGVQIGAVNTTVLGASTVTSASIGSLPLASPTGYFNGSAGPINPIKGTLTDSEMLTLERVVANLTPNGPTF